MQLNCKVIKKWQLSSTSTPPFQSYTPFLPKFLVPPPQVTQFLEGPAPPPPPPPFNKGRGFPAMLNQINKKDFARWPFSSFFVIFFSGWLLLCFFIARYEHISLSFVEMVGYYNEIFRNSRSQMFLKMIVLNNYANFTGKYL